MEGEISGWSPEHTRRRPRPQCPVAVLEQAEDGEGRQTSCAVDSLPGRVPECGESTQPARPDRALTIFNQHRDHPFGQLVMRAVVRDAAPEDPADSFYIAEPRPETAVPGAE